MYFDVTNSAVDGEFSRAAATFFVLVTIAFTPPFTAVTLWAGERGLVRREEMQGTYSLSAFYAAKTLTLVPMEILFSLMVRPCPCGGTLRSILTVVMSERTEQGAARVMRGWRVRYQLHAPAASQSRASVRWQLGL